MRDERTGWITLSVAEFFLLWRAAGHADPPLPLQVPHFTRTRQQFEELAREGSEVLGQRGLGTVFEPAEDLADLLAVFADHERAVDLLVARDAAPVRGLAAAGRRGAAVAAIAGEEVRIGPARADGLVRPLLDALDPLPAAPGRSANIGWADYLRACAEGEAMGADAFLALLRECGLRNPEAHTVLRAVSERRGGGQLGASVRDRDGRQLRAPSPVSWVDTLEGRYSFRVSDGWLTVTPVDLPRLYVMAEEMLSEATQLAAAGVG